ncbi:MAG: hypothetical protein D6753_09240 [Planctomycetota bacterium]|nr:MAG: hypothetical protein D6753_09240 [Planctomycetota bacterium]
MTNLLHELVLAPCRLPPEGRNTDSLQTALSVDFQALGSNRTVHLSTPWILRRWADRSAVPDWPELCAVMHKFGGAVVAPAADLAAVDVSHLPVRIGPVCRDTPLDPDEIGTADLIEFDLRHASNKRWGWPVELESEGKLFAFIEALRIAAGGDVPVGLALPLNCQADELRKVMQSGADFVSLVAERHDPMQAWVLRGIRAARESCVAEGMPDLPLLLDAELDSPWAAFVCLALGASAVTVDAMLAPILAQQTAQQPVSGMLAGILPDFPAAGRADRIAALLDEANDQMHELLRLQGVRRLGELSPKCLRAVRPDVARITGVDQL